MRCRGLGPAPARPHPPTPTAGKRDGGCSRPQLLTLLLGAPGALAPPPESRVTVDVERSIPQRQSAAGSARSSPAAGIIARDPPCAGEVRAGSRSGCGWAGAGGGGPAGSEARRGRGGGGAGAGRAPSALVRPVRPHFLPGAQTEPKLSAVVSLPRGALPGPSSSAKEPRIPWRPRLSAACSAKVHLSIHPFCAQPPTPTPPAPGGSLTPQDHWDPHPVSFIQY